MAVPEFRPGGFTPVEKAVSKPKCAKALVRYFAIDSSYSRLVLGAMTYLGSSPVYLYIAPISFVRFSGSISQFAGNNTCGTPNFLFAS